VIKYVLQEYDFLVSCCLLTIVVFGVEAVLCTFTFTLSAFPPCTLHTDAHCLVHKTLLQILCSIPCRPFTVAACK